MLRSLNCHVSWLWPEPSARLPLSRATDVSRPGKGMVCLPEPVSNPRLPKGIRTDFTSSDFGIGFSLYLPRIIGEADNSILGRYYTRTRGSHPKARVNFYKASFQLMGTRDLVEDKASGFQGCIFDVAPHIDKTEMFQPVFNRLQTGGY